MLAIEAKKLSHKQGTKFLIKDINWRVQTKEHWIIFGLNGCGKTTLLSIIAGYRGYSHGDVYLFGERFSTDNTIELRKELGFVSASYFDQCFNYENVLNIVLGGIYGGLSERDDLADQDVSKAKQLLRALGLKAKASYPYDLLSQGQRQKVLLARALMAPPKLLILDEPCTGLDIFAKDFFLNTLTQIAEETEVTIIYVTHHADEILPFFNKALLLKNGTIHSQGDLKQLFQPDNLSDFFNQPTVVNWENERVQFSIGHDLRMPKATWLADHNEERR